MDLTVCSDKLYAFSLNGIVTEHYCIIAVSLMHHYCIINISLAIINVSLLYHYCIIADHNVLLLYYSRILTVSLTCHYYNIAVSLTYHWRS